MVSSILSAVVDFYFSLISYVVGNFLGGFFSALQQFGAIPNDYFNIFTNWINNSFYPGLKFARDVVINCTGIDIQFFIFIVYILFFVFNFYLVLLCFKFLLNAWSWFRVGRSVTSIYNDK